MAIIYVDAVFILNFIIDYLLLYTTGKMLKNNASKLIVGCGAIIGAFYSVLMLCVNYSVFSSFLSKMLFSMFLVRLTYGRMHLKGFLRATVMFYFVNFAFCGGIYAVAAMFGMNDRYVTFGIFTLYSVVAYGVLSVASRHHKRTIEKQKIKLVIGLNSKQSEIDCIIDTGNSLCTPYSGKPVIVAERTELNGIIPSDFPENSDIKPIIIPFNSLGCDKGVIYGFKPDYAYFLCDGKKKKIRRAVIGLYDGILSTDGNFKGLVNPVLIA